MGLPLLTQMNSIGLNKMTKQIKLTVSTGWAGGDHVDYVDLPDEWEELTERQQELLIDELGAGYLHEVCGCCGEVVDEED